MCPKLFRSRTVARHDSLSYYFATRTVQGYPAERIGPVKSQKAGDGPEVPVLTTAVGVNWLPGVVCKSLSVVERDYRLYRGVIDGDERQPANLPADVAEALDSILPQETVWEGNGGSSFTADDRLVIATSLERLAETVPTLDSEFSDLALGLFDEVESFVAATAKVEEDVER